jgi:hypothetical protein
MTRLATSFVLGYHGCDRAVGERVLGGDPFKMSNNSYDWLGPGVYFWEANPQRGLDFAREASRRGAAITEPFVVGAVIDLHHCLDLTTMASIRLMKASHQALVRFARRSGEALPKNSLDGRLRRLDCLIVRRAVARLDKEGDGPVDTVRAVMVEGGPIYPTAGFCEKTHVQIAVRNPACIKGVFRVPSDQLRMPELADRIARARKASTN